MQFKPIKSTLKNQQYIENKIVEYNMKFVPFTQAKPFIRLDYHLKDQKEEIIAGINSRN